MKKLKLVNRGADYMIELDPRPDLHYDSKEWTILLILADTTNQILAGILHGFRCCGLRLHRGKEGYALRPDLDPEMSKWITKNGYEADRDKWLMPYKNEIVGLLEQLNKRMV
jgi:hypothetical protein